MSDQWASEVLHSLAGHVASLHLQVCRMFSVICNEPRLNSNIFHGHRCHSLCQRSPSRAARDNLEAKDLQGLPERRRLELCDLRHTSQRRASQRSHRCTVLTRPETTAQGIGKDFRVGGRSRACLTPYHNRAVFSDETQAFGALCRRQLSPPRACLWAWRQTEE